MAKSKSRGGKVAYREWNARGKYGKHSSLKQKEREIISVTLDKLGSQHQGCGPVKALWTIWRPARSQEINLPWFLKSHVGSVCLSHIFLLFLFSPRLITVQLSRLSSPTLSRRWMAGQLVRCSCCDTVKVSVWAPLWSEQVTETPTEILSLSQYASKQTPAACKVRIMWLTGSQPGIIGSKLIC